MHTFVLTRLLEDLPQNARVGKADDKQRNEVHDEHAKQVVGGLLGLRLEKSKGHALSEVLVNGVLRNVEHNALQHENKIQLIYFA